MKLQQTEQDCVQASGAGNADALKTDFLEFFFF